MYSESVKVANIFAKYSNPIAQIVQNACAFDSEIHAQVNNRRVNLKSIMGIMAFEWKEGMEVVVDAEGNDAEDAVKAICKYLLCEA